jgi:hypothetical protein
MTFETFTSSTRDLCDKIANKMISTSGGYWTDGDTEFTTSGNPPGRCLKYYNAGTGETYYIALVAGAFAGGTSNPETMECVFVFFSTGWDSVNHKPSGTVVLTAIPVTNYDGAISLKDRTGQAWMWYDDNGFTLLWKTNPTTAHDCVTLFVLERDTAKEYSDGYTNFFMMVESLAANHMSEWGHYYEHNIRWKYAPAVWTLPSGWDTLKVHCAKYHHPFGTELPPLNTNCENYFNFTEGHDWDALMWYNPIRARKSPGNAKVYLGFGWAFNDTAVAPEGFKNFIKKIKTFFAVKAGTGLADGDIINVVVGAETWQYIYKSVVSPDGGQLDVAIRYA